MSAWMSQAVMGTNVIAFLVVNLVLAGGGAWITGRAIATGWKPMWQALAYCVLLALATRFVLFALFDAALTSIPGLLFALVILVAFGAASFRINRARKMVSQYPWLYERAGLMAWRERHPSIHGGQ